MSLALDLTPAAVPALRRRGLALSPARRDAVALTVLAALWAGVLLLRYNAVPMQLWDESRNANSALEMAQYGRWLTPTYAGVVDHWNTKPPLLIWAMAGLLRLGLPPLAALRLPSWLAAAGTALTLWGVLRFGFKDRTAALAAGVLLLSAPLYIGPHAARTADYDALESAFLVGYVLAVWRAFDVGRARWLAVAAALIGLGVLTKGVAALLPLPGLALYALTRPRRLLAFIRNARAWAAAGLFLLLAGGYYLSRELYDPGYLSIVADNELGGRFLKVTENHRGSWNFYLLALLQFAEPGALLSGFGVVTLMGRDGRRRGLVLACGLAAVSLLGVLTVSKSKMQWYAAPLVPLLCLIAGAGIADTLRWVRAAHPRWATPGMAAAALVLAAGAGFGLWWNQSGASWASRSPGAVQLGYGPFLRKLRARGVSSPLTVVDTGFHNDAGFAAYDPMLKFYAEDLAPRGLSLRIVHLAEGLQPGQAVATCDPRTMRVLRQAYSLTAVWSDSGCLSARVAGRP